MSILSNMDAILDNDDLPYEDVEVPEWNGTVRLRAMTGNERDSFESNTDDEGRLSRQGLRARLVGLCAVSEEGKRLFSDSQIRKLGEKSSIVLDRLFWVAMSINGMSKKDEEELLENFDETDGSN